MAALALVVIALLLTVPGYLLVRALHRNGTPRSALGVAEDLGLAVAASMAILVVVGSILGHHGLYRFAATGAPVVEAVLLAIVAGCGALALSGRVRARKAVATEA